MELDTCRLALISGYMAWLTKAQHSVSLYQNKRDSYMGTADPERQTCAEKFV